MVKPYLSQARRLLTDPRTNFKRGSKGPKDAGGNGLISLYGHSNEHDLTDGRLPVVTTKKVYLPGVATELFWFMNGDTNIKYLEDNKCTIWRRDVFHHNLDSMVKAGIFKPEDGEKYTERWTEALKQYGTMIREDEDFARQYGNAGPIYGEQWRAQQGVRNGKIVVTDQLEDLINGLAKKPMGKRHIVNSWNAAQIDQMALPPCHVKFQATANADGELDLSMDQRSCDFFLGVPFNVASYALLTHMIAHEVNRRNPKQKLTPRTFVHEFDDFHLYTGFAERSAWYEQNLDELKKRVAAVPEDQPEGYLEVKEWVDNNAPKNPLEEEYDQIPAILEQLSREPKEAPTIKLADKSIFDMTEQDVTYKGYEHHPRIPRKMVV